MEVIREPVETRYLSLKNIDNKLVVSANVRKLEPQYRRATRKTPNGLAPSRNFLNNLLDLGSAGEIVSIISESMCPHPTLPSNAPIPGALDCKTALPSVIHAWICWALLYQDISMEYIRLFMGVWDNASVVFSEINYN